MKFIATTSDKIKDIAIISGQLIFSRDDRAIYLDAGSERTTFQQIITLLSEEIRQGLASPLQGFYFIMDTKTLWSYDGKYWTQVTEKPRENLVFGEYDEFPETGEEKVLYVDEKNIYRWSEKKQDYSELGALTWDTIS